MFEGVADLAALQQRTAFDAQRCSKGSSSVQGGPSFNGVPSNLNLLGFGHSILETIAAAASSY